LNFSGKIAQRLINLRKKLPLMRGKKLLIGLAALTCLSGSCCSRHFTKQDAKMYETSTVIDLDVGKGDTDLKCEQVDKISTQGFSFYACHEDIDFKLIDNIEYIAAVKKYGREVLGFKDTHNYQVYKNNVTEKPKEYHRLYVTDKFKIPQKLDAYKKHIGKDGKHREKIKEPTCFSSHKDKLIDEEEHYNSLGYDTVRSTSINFTSSSIGADISISFLKDPKVEQADTILHEDLHRHLDLESVIEESIATIIGGAGAIDFAARYFGKGSKEHKEAIKELEDWLKYARKVTDCNNKLLKLYARKDLTDEEKLEEKEDIIDESGYLFNNARIWRQVPYTKNFLLVHKIYESYPDIRVLIKILMDTPKEEDKAIEYLKGFLAEE
jgi:hypothetical protein